MNAYGRLDPCLATPSSLCAFFSLKPPKKSVDNTNVCNTWEYGVARQLRPPKRKRRCRERSIAMGGAFSNLDPWRQALHLVEQSKTSIPGLSGHSECEAHTNTGSRRHLPDWTLW